MLLNAQWVIEDIKKDIKKIPSMNTDINTVHQNMWDTAKTVLR